MDIQEAKDLVIERIKNLKISATEPEIFERDGQLQGEQTFTFGEGESEQELVAWSCCGWLPGHMSNFDGGARQYTGSTPKWETCDSDGSSRGRPRARIDRGYRVFVEAPDDYVELTDYLFEGLGDFIREDDAGDCTFHAWVEETALDLLTDYTDELYQLPDEPTAKQIFEDLEEGDGGFDWRVGGGKLVVGQYKGLGPWWVGMDFGRGPAPRYQVRLQQETLGELLEQFFDGALSELNQQDD